MNQFIRIRNFRILVISLIFSNCASIKRINERLVPEPYTYDRSIPMAYQDSKDTTNVADIKWREYFSDQNLINLIDTALVSNQELLITLQDIEIAQNVINYRHGLLSPTVTAGGAIGFEKVGRFTSQGAGDASADITDGKKVPDILGDYFGGINASWELNVWNKIKTFKKAALAKYVATTEGKNFVITNLVAEVANAYYELLALDNQLDIIRETIRLQQSALAIVRVQKQASRVTELAVKKFEAEVLNSQSLEYDILQKITEAENKINFLLGRYPQPVIRDKSTFFTQSPRQITAGIPSQLLKNRPDIKRAEAELYATACDVKVAQAEFYPSIRITAALGFQAFNPLYLVRLPESILSSLAGDIVAPLVNKTAIRAEFNTAKAIQVQAMYDYQKVILNGYLEVATELSNINNLAQMYALKNQEVETLTKSIDVANELFKYAKADYLEVLLTQRDALESKLELVETKKRQFNAFTNIYRALGGGWN